MARNNIDGTGWLIEQRDSTVVKRFARTSVVEDEFRTINMTANTVRIPRIDDMDIDIIPKGAAYGEDQSSADTIAISASKFGKALRIAEEDVADDKLADYLGEKKASAASSFAKKLDNAALGVTAGSTGPGTTVPFTSLYRTLSTVDATTGYTAGANLLSGASLSYDLLNQLLAIVENSDYYDESSVIAVAHPAFRQALRGIKDGQGRPLFLTDVVNGANVDTILGRRIRYTVGAKTSAVAVTNNAGAGGAKGAAGNPLFGFVNTQHAVVGKRSPLESVVIPGRDGLSALTDEDILKVRARRAAGYTIPGAHSLFEQTSA